MEKRGYCGSHASQSRGIVSDLPPQYICASHIFGMEKYVESRVRKVLTTSLFVLAELCFLEGQIDPALERVQKMTRIAPARIVTYEADDCAPCRFTGVVLPSV